MKTGQQRKTLEVCGQLILDTGLLTSNKNKNKTADFKPYRQKKRKLWKKKKFGKAVLHNGQTLELM